MKSGKYPVWGEIYSVFAVKIMLQKIIGLIEIPIQIKI